MMEENFGENFNEENFSEDKYKEEQEKKDFKILDIFNEIGMMYLNKKNLDVEVAIQRNNGRTAKDINKKLSNYLKYVSEMYDILQDLIDKNIEGSLN